MTSCPYLETIRSPEDLRNFSFQDLVSLSEEIRQKIIHTVSTTGGHLSSNLGAIELTIALHYVFSSPQDAFIFDTGHQCYAHKLLTGRNHHEFHAMRHDQGLSGFSNPNESPHDLFFSGHAGNALSLALGMAQASRQNHVIPILGDAALSCGLTLEALNNISKNLSKFIVVLNDNNMFISETVGALSKILSCKGPSQQLAQFFSSFNLFYTGPIDGHNFQELIPALQSIRNFDHPVLVHVRTKKGNGYKVAEQNPSRYHGVPASYTGPTNPQEPPAPTFPKIFGQTLCSMGEVFQDLHVVVPAMSLGSCIEDFKQRFPNRYVDVGIAEGHAVTYSAGLVHAGIPTICSLYSTFLQRALDNIFHDVCVQSLPVIFAIDRAGLSCGDGRTHHGIYDLSFLRTMPGCIICQPRDGDLLRTLLFSAMQWQQPTAIRYPNLSIADDLSSKFSTLTREIGRGDLLCHGDDLLIIALGHMCTTALHVKDALLQFGLTSTIIDPVFIKPLDEDLLHQMLMYHSKVVIIEEHSAIGGLGSAIYEFLYKYHLRAEILHCAIHDAFVDHGERHTVLQRTGLSPQIITQRILSHFHFSEAFTQCVTTS